MVLYVITTVVPLIHDPEEYELTDNIKPNLYSAFCYTYAGTSDCLWKIEIKHKTFLV